MRPGLLVRAQLQEMHRACRGAGYRAHAGRCDGEDSDVVVGCESGEFHPVRYVPHPHHPVGAAGDRAAAVRTDGKGLDAVLGGSGSGEQELQSSASRRDLLTGCQGDDQ